MPGQPFHRLGSGLSQNRCGQFPDAVGPDVPRRVARDDAGRSRRRPKQPTKRSSGCRRRRNDASRREAARAEERLGGWGSASGSLAKLVVVSPRNSSDIGPLPEASSERPARPMDLVSSRPAIQPNLPDQSGSSGLHRPRTIGPAARQVGGSARRRYRAMVFLAAGAGCATGSWAAWPGPISTSSERCGFAVS